MAGGTAHPYTAQQVAGYAQKAGFKGEDLVTAIAVSRAESGWTMKRSIRANNNGTYDWGLWQINDVHKPSDAVKTDPQANANEAFKVFGGSGWGAWSTYNNGAFKTFLPAAREGAKNPSVTGGSIGDVPKAVEKVKDSVDIPGAIAAFTSQANKIAGNLTTILVALVLLVIGILLINGKSVIGTASTVAGAVVNPVGTGIKTVAGAVS